MNTKKGLWTVIKSKKVYQNPWIFVKEDKVIRPDGKEGIFGVVEMKPGVSILPIDNEGNVYLTKEYHYAVERETIEVISGGIDQEENKQEAAVRELQEETGIIADELVDLGVIDPFTTVVVSPNYLYLAKGLKFSDANPEGTENIKVIKVSMSEAIQWVIDSKITHGASTALILKAKSYLGM
ncbi:MAG: NUDIX hydrolase [Candidatus Levybacteria bacterium]|nr:NUDIX hydrolase [Candidatus Levybacteria bacterium]